MPSPHESAVRRPPGCWLQRRPSRRRRKGYSKEQLPVFDRIPSSKWGVVPLILQVRAGGPVRCRLHGGTRARGITGAWRCSSTNTPRAQRRWSRRSRRIRPRDARRDQDRRPPGRHECVQGGIRLPRRAARGGLLHMARHQSGRSGRRSPMSGTDLARSALAW